MLNEKNIRLVINNKGKKRYDALLPLRYKDTSFLLGYEKNLYYYENYGYGKNYKIKNYDVKR